MSKSKLEAEAAVDEAQSEHDKCVADLKDQHAKDMREVKGELSESKSEAERKVAMAEAHVAQLKVLQSPPTVSSLPSSLSCPPFLSPPLSSPFLFYSRPLLSVFGTSAC